MNRFMGLKNINLVYSGGNRAERGAGGTAKSCGQNKHSLRITELRL
jgi:hypothetical protein